MAEHENGRMDLAEHRKTYDLFLGLSKWTVIIVSAILILMAIFLV